MCIMEYKKQFSLEELAEVEGWLKARWERLPQSLRLNTGVNIPDLKLTLTHYFDVAHDLNDNPTYSGQIYHLFLIRKKLLELHPQLA